MIITLVIIIGFYLWLLYKTDWLKIRLPVGIQCTYTASCQWRLSDNAVTNDMKLELVGLSNNGHKLAWGEFKVWMIPLCGWGYAYQYRNFAPEYKIELIAPGSKYTFRTQSISVSIKGGI